MYLQITTRCNMTCKHCCFACKKTGEDMSRQVFDAAIKLCCDYDSPIAIGGGEPTLHDDFEYFICAAMSMTHKTGHRPFIVTNGTHKRRALLLHGLHVGNLLEAHLSHDQYHDMDMVDTDVFDLYHNDAMLWGKGTREGHTIAAHGRGKKIKGARPFCACEDRIIKPSGTIHFCGCENSPVVGNVFDGIDMPDDLTFSGESCYNDFLKVMKYRELTKCSNA